MSREERFRMAQECISQAKRLLNDEWYEYHEIQTITYVLGTALFQLDKAIEHNSEGKLS